MGKDNVKNEKVVWEEENPTPFNRYWLSFNRNVLNNARFYFGIFLAFYLYNSIKIDDLTENVENVRAELEKSRGTFVGVTTDGRLVNIKTQELKIDNYGPMVTTIIEDYLITSRVKLTENSKSPIFEDPISLLKSLNEDPYARNPRTFYNYFVDNKEDEQGVKKGYESFMNYVRKLVIQLRKGEMPISVDVVSSKLDETTGWVVNGNKFKIKIQTDVIISGVTEGGLKFNNLNTFGIYEITGYFDLEQAIPVHNPFGIKITNIASVIPKNATNQEVQE